jgi:hypothetical protein
MLNGVVLMNIYNEQGDMTSERVSKVSGRVADSVSALATSLLAEGTPVVEVRAMLDYIETAMRYAAILCFLNYSVEEGGRPVPVKVHGEYPACLADDCPHHKECANHSSAGDSRSLHGDTPTLIRCGSEWLCTKSPERNRRGAILIDGTFMEKR